MKEKNKKRICVVTGSRADYGLLYWVMKEIALRPELELIPVATGAHLETEWGNTIDQIVKDGFENVVRIKAFSGDTSPHGIALTMSETLKSFSAFFKETLIDMLIVLGDRYEILASALAALPYNLPVAHLGGGEVSEGVIDENIRHCLTKLSHMHFVITEKCAERVIKMGEEPWRVKTVGSPRLDFMKKLEYRTKDELKKELGISFSGKTALVIFHPSTLENEGTAAQTDNLLEALRKADCEKIMFYPNIDIGSDIIVKKVESFAADKKNRAHVFKPLPMESYIGVLDSVDLMIGNSSAGIVEAPSFKLPVVNVGNRQKGRDCMKNVIHTGTSASEILNGIEKALDSKFRSSLHSMKNIYGDGRASEKIADIITKIDFSDFNIAKKNCLG